MPFASTVRRSWPWVAPAVFGVGWFLLLGGGRTLNPTEPWWMIEGDWFSAFFAWCFYRNAPLGIPLGAIPDLQYPFGTSTGMNDALPLFSGLLRPFSFLMPEAFQLFGVWMALGHAAMGVVGSRLVARVSQDPWLQMLGGLMLVLNPIVTSRYGHPSFLGLWTVFGLIGLVLSAERSSWRDQWIGWALLGVACGTHPYLAAMAMPLAFAAGLRVVGDRSFGGPAQWLLAAVAPIGVALFSLWFAGYLSSLGKVQGGAEGFGEFSADLIALVNPSTWSRFIPPLRVGPRQLEGFAYLGLGGMVLALIAAFRGVTLLRRPRAVLPWLPLVALVAALAVFALSDRVTFLGQVLIDLRGLYAPLGSLTSMFRSSGRFLFPLHALLVVGGILTVARVSLQQRWLGRAVLGVVVVLQFADLDFRTSSLGKPGPAFRPLESSAWRTMGADYRHLAIIPAQLQWFSPFDGDYVARLSWEAYRQKMTINSGHTGRPPLGFEWDHHFAPSELDAATVYVVYFREWLDDFLRAGWTCGVAEGLVACVDPSRETPLKAALEDGARRRQPALLRPMH